MKKIFTLILLVVALGISAQPPKIYTLGHDNITTGPRNFNLYGAINSYNSNVAYSFIYSTDPTFATSMSTPVQTMPFDSLTVAWGTVDSLTAASTYYYYLSANTTNGPRQGDTLNFNSDSTNTYFDIYGADVYPSPQGSGVSMNGIVSGLTGSTTLYFQWGTAPDNLDSVVISDIGTVSDANSHNARGSVFSGINWGQLYFYRMIGVQATDTLFSDIRPFFIGFPFTTLNLLPATSVGTTTANMNGQVQGFTLPLKLDVEYGLGVGNHHSPLVYVPNDTALYNYTYAAGGLQNNAQYNYRFRAESWLGNFYGNNGGDMIFLTGDKDSVFQTLAATNVTATSATLNGFANHLNTEIVGSFVYGTSPGALDSVVVADTINDNQTHYPTFTLSHLTPGTTYYYVLKGGEYGDWQGTGPHIYGDTLTFVTGINGIINVPSNTADIAVFPNPVSNSLHFTFGNNGNFAYVRVSDLQGREILTRNITAGNAMDVSNLSAGVYFIQAFTKEGEPSGITKFVKL